ncbi:hypothetical protein BJ875DRAFT_484911 [Amylocarpus encephaloides]|uniref:Pre-mRNA-splicing factor 38B n=1 Tax=Amylocarpus encephaloides TaxID=45428 RepID=A0A9P7YIM2_9HELO|nr:hypothetical protein BJ875DRAFT_484911 [Amylocarpus encephaloides]
MPGDDLDDDSVANLLKQDAKDLKGMFAMSSSSPSKPANKPKPNTRFLRNIIKDTDSHNAALLVKEAADSRARLQGLAGPEDQSKRSSRPPFDIRKRQLGDIAAILGGGSGKRRRAQDDERSSTKRPRRSTSGGEDESTDAVKGNRESKRGERVRQRERDGHYRSRSPERHRRPRSTSRDRYRVHKERERDLKVSGGEGARQKDLIGDGQAQRAGREIRRYHRSDHRSDVHYSDDDDDDDYDRHGNHHGRQETHRGLLEDTGRDRENPRRRRRFHSRSRSRSPRSRRNKGSTRYRSRSPRRKRSRSPRTHRKTHKDSIVADRKAHDHNAKQAKEAEYDSDPLSSILGPRPLPAPEIRSRGRGTFSHGAGIDSRFSADYDPAMDVQLDPEEENDWDQALEALRDRQKWKQQGADRLKAAGFTEEEILKWEKGGEKSEEHVKWSKVGEGREWDKGKVVDEFTGTMTIESAFGRLKDT